mmetsp:Transcript_5668/g.26182  ORF Transcript_5668/g.26182 Transcript_5668/m.26182 type:complete len:306 (+) Transcript_5668:1287-2204(+)
MWIGADPEGTASPPAPTRLIRLSHLLALSSSVSSNSNGSSFVRPDLDPPDPLDDLVRMSERCCSRRGNPALTAYTRMHSTCPPAAARCRGVAPSTPDLASGFAPYSAYSASTISARPLRHAWWSIVSPAASADSSTSVIVRPFRRRGSSKARLTIGSFPSAARLCTVAVASNSMTAAMIDSRSLTSLAVSPFSFETHASTSSRRRSLWTLRSLPAEHAQCRGVLPSLSRALVFPPPSSTASSTSTLPQNAATCAGVRPRRPSTFGSAPSAISRLATMTSPRSAAMCNAARPSPSISSRSAPRLCA